MGIQWELQIWVGNIWVDEPENLDPVFSRMLHADSLFPLPEKSSLTLCGDPESTSPDAVELQDDPLPPQDLPLLPLIAPGSYLSIAQA